MRRFLLIFLLLLLFSFSAVYSLESEFTYSEVLFTVKDIETDEAIIASPVMIDLMNLERGTEISSVKYIDYDGQIDYKLSPGTWKVVLKVDTRKTPAFDYYSEDSISIGDDDINKTIYAYPVGSISGEVLDSKGSLVANADIDFKCKSDLNLGYPTKSDAFGSFKAEMLPVGECTAFAAYKGLAGSTDTIVQKGNLTSIKIMLDKPLQSSNNLLYVLGGALLFIFAALMIYKIFSKGLKEKVKQELTKEKLKLKKQAQIKKAKEEEKKDKEEKSDNKDNGDNKDNKDKEEERHKHKAEHLAQASHNDFHHETVPDKEEEKDLNPRARDIMKTLNDREIKIVEFLLEAGNKSTQATLRNATGIPKTSLARAFFSLEGKKIIKVETIGKLKKIELTDWFMGKD